MKKSFAYLAWIPSSMQPTPKSCIGISFSGVGRGGNELLIEVYADNIDEADRKLRDCVNSLNARIIPIPFEVAGVLQHTMIMRSQVEFNIFYLQKDPEVLINALPKVKRFVGEQIALRSKQISRLKRLIQKIKKFEDVADPSLLSFIAMEIYHLAINPDQLQD